MSVAVAERKQRKRFDTSPTPDAPRGRSPITGAPVPAGRPKGVPNKATRTIREAIEAACQPGQCHPQGLAGWLVERATGNVEDRKIFAGLVARVVPQQLHATVDQVVVQLPWLAGRSVVSTQPRTQPKVLDAQVVEPAHVLTHDLRVDDPSIASAPFEAEPIAPVVAAADPHPPVERQAGGAVE